MGSHLNAILEVRLFQAFDLDAEGRVLAGSDETGSTQLVEIESDGTMTPLTALPGACSGRYLPGQRAVIVSHDEGGNEQHQLSVLRLPVPSGRPAGLDDLEPLVRDPRFMHVLADVRGDQLCYFVNRRNGVAFDPVIRQLADGSERAMVLADAMFREAAISPDGRWLALTVASPVTAASDHVAIVDLAVPAGEERMTDVTAPDAPAGMTRWPGRRTARPCTSARTTTGSSSPSRGTTWRPAGLLAGRRRRRRPDRLALAGRLGHAGRAQ